MSGAAPVLAPEPKPAASPAPAPSPSRGRWYIAALFLAIAAGAAWYWSAQAQNRAAPAGPAVRTAAVVSAPLVRTLRVSGTTAAERYVALTVPQLRGRGEGRREAREFQSGQNLNTTVQSNAAAGGSGAGSSAAASGSLTVQSTSGAASPGASTAFRQSTSRIARSTTARRGGTAAAATGSALGSTSDSLISWGGGGGGGSIFDFLLILQDLAKPGSRVRKGEVVGEFDRLHMMNRVDDFRVALAQTEANFRKFDAELEAGRKAHAQTVEAARADLEKARLDVKTIPVLSAIESERVRLALEEAEARHRQLEEEAKLVEVGMKSQRRNAQIDLDQARIELKRVQANADRMIVRAPLDGLVVVQNTFRGSEFTQIQKGDQLFSGMMFMQIVDPSSMVVDAVVNQVDVERVRIGSRATVRFDAYPGLTLPARVVSIGAITRPGGQRASFVKELPVRLKLEGSDPRVIPDLSVSADLELESERQATLAPLASVFQDRPGTVPYVYVRQGARWDRRAVETGVRNNLSVVIRSGLKPGETVALERPPAGAGG